MNLNFSFFITNIMLGLALAMDAFSVSVANGLNEPKMKKMRLCFIAGVFAIFQFLMPLIGFFCVTTIARIFLVFQNFIPIIALILLCYIGAKMIFDCIKNKNDKNAQQSDFSKSPRTSTALANKTLFLQGVATSIDALSVGFTISTYSVINAIFASILIGLTTFIICFIGLLLGKKAGTKFSNKAGIFGGVILIIIGIRIFVASLNF